MLNGVMHAVATAAGDTGSTGDGGSDFDPTAWIALVLSILSIFASFLLRYLDGPRLRVRVTPVLFNVGYGSDIRYFGGRWPIPEKSMGVSLKRPDPGEVIDLAEIVIENAGRHPMTVYDIGFVWKGTRKNWWRRRTRHHNVPTPLRPPHYDGRVFAEGDQFRLEPADVVTVLVDYWNVVRANRPSPKGRIELRAAVHVAGRRSLKWSPWRSRWKIRDEAVTAVGNRRKIPLRAVISKSIGLQLLIGKAKTLGDVYFLSRSLEAALGGQWSDDWKANHERLDEFEKDSSVHFETYKDKDSMVGFVLMFGLHRAIDDYKDDIDWDDIAQPNLHKMFSKKARAEKKAAEVASRDAQSELPLASDEVGPAPSQSPD